jgi:hypothetical protein
VRSFDRREAEGGEMGTVSFGKCLKDQWRVDACELMRDAGVDWRLFTQVVPRGVGIFFDASANCGYEARAKIEQLSDALNVE